MSIFKDISTFPARIQASNATRDAIFEVLKRYIQQVQSRGDELDADTFYDEFIQYYRKNWLPND